jgi:O-antigen ligase
MLESFRSKIGSLNTWLFASLFFLIPIKVSPAYMVSLLILVLSLVEGDWSRKWRMLRQEPLFWIFQAFFWVFALSLFWTSDLKTGIDSVIGHYAFFLLSGLYLTIARPEMARRCIGFFLAACAFTESLAIYNWLQIHAFTHWPAGIRVHKDPQDIAPFVDRILFAPALAWGAYLSIRQTLQNGAGLRVLYGLLAVTTIGVLMLSGGRTGQLTFFVLLCVVVFQRLARKPVLAALVACVLVTGLAGGAYSLSDRFKQRVDDAVHEVTHYKEAVNTSVGLRINFYINTWRVFADNPWVGVGVGDYQSEYAEVNRRHSPDWEVHRNPHNQYLFVLSTTGILGGVVMLFVFLPPALWRPPGQRPTQLQVAFLVFTGFICIFESYLWRSNTSLLFVLFSCVLMQSRQRFRNDSC